MAVQIVISPLKDNDMQEAVTEAYKLYARHSPFCESFPYVFEKEIYLPMKKDIDLDLFRIMSREYNISGLAREIKLVEKDEIPEQEY